VAGLPGRPCRRPTDIQLDSKRLAIGPRGHDAAVVGAPDGGTRGGIASEDEWGYGPEPALTLDREHSDMRAHGLEKRRAAGRATAVMRRFY
jgi:hypothetical protein